MAPDDDMETAAQAFDAAISADQRGNPPAPPEDTSKNKPTDRMFENLGKTEVDDESPEKGGGDDLPDPEEAIYAKDNKGKRKDAPDAEEPGEEEDSEEDAGEAEEEGVDAGELDLETKVKVMVDGEEATVPLKEALEGYIRTETFHRRLSEMSESQKVVQAAAADVVQNYQYARQLIDVMEGQLKELVPPEPDWDKEFAADPQKARNLQKYYAQVAEFKTKLQTQREEINQKQEAHNAEQLKVYAQQEEIRFNRINSKNWGVDPSRKTKDLQAMRRTALTEGFTEEELNGVFDSRMLQVLLKASKYDRITATTPKPKQMGIKPVPPGPGKRSVNGTGRKGIADAMNKLARTGTIEDAAPVFDQILRQR
jgi:hypothetical protein